MATDFGKISEMTFIQHAGILQRIRMSQFRFTGVKGRNFATFYAILVKIGPLTPDIRRVSIPFGTRQQKSTCHTKYLGKYWTELHQLFSIGRCMYADCTTEIFFLWQLKRRFYRNRLTLGSFCRLQNCTSSLFALAVRNKMQHRFVNAQFNSCTNVSTS